MLRWGSFNKIPVSLHTFLFIWFLQVMLGWMLWLWTNLLFRNGSFSLHEILFHIRLYREEKGSFFSVYTPDPRLLRLWAETLELVNDGGTRSQNPSPPPYSLRYRGLGNLPPDVVCPVSLGTRRSISCVPWEPSPGPSPFCGAPTLD